MRCGAPPGEFVPSQRASTLAGLPRSRAVPLAAMVSLDSRIRSDQCVEGWARAGTKIVRQLVDYDYFGRRGGEEASERAREERRQPDQRGKSSRKAGEGEGEVCRRRWDGRDGRVREHSTSTQGHPPGSGGCGGEWCGPVGGCGAVVFSRLEPGCGGGRRTARDGSTTRVWQGSGKGQDRALGGQGCPGWVPKYFGKVLSSCFFSSPSLQDIVP